MPINPRYLPNYEDWLRKDIWELEDAACLLLKVEPLKKERLILKSRKFKSSYLAILDTAEKAIDRTLEIESNIYNYFGYAEVKPNVFIKWANVKGFEIPPPLQYMLDATDEAEKPSAQETKSISSLEPLTTAPELLKNAVDAWSRIWKKEELGINPGQKKIIPWLVSKYSISSNEAVAIDKIIRPKKRKKGALNK